MSKIQFNNIQFIQIKKNYPEYLSRNVRMSGCVNDV